MLEQKRVSDREDSGCSEKSHEAERCYPEAKLLIHKLSKGLLLTLAPGQPLGWV